MNRSDMLGGATYKAKLENDQNIYVTVNEQGGEPFEVFVRLDVPELYEWAAATTVLITRLLRAGEPLQVIAKELQEIHSPVMKPWHKGNQVPSLPALIGVLLERHGVIGVAA